MFTRHVELIKEIVTEPELLKITKHNISFNVAGKFSKYWFNRCIEKWELDTFHILDYYQNVADGIYIDIGA